MFGIPIGRLADRMNRKSIIAVGVVIWSLMATLCGLARNFAQLFLARIGVGVGEAALSPAAYSMITDAFPREKLGRAFSVYNMGIAIGSGIAMLVGGLVVAAVSGEGQTFTLPLLGEVRAWQFVFIVTGAPGLILPLLLLTRARARAPRPAQDREQRRRRPEAAAARGDHIHAQERSLLQPALLRDGDDGDARLRGRRVAADGHGAHLRHHRRARSARCSASPRSRSTRIGIFVAGRICDRLTKQGHTDAPIWVCFGVAIAVVCTSALPAFMPSATLGLTMMCIAGLPFHGYVAMGPMAVNQVTPNQMRAQVSAVYLFTVNFLGLGFGPALVPMISDYILRDPMQIRWGLLDRRRHAGHDRRDPAVARPPVYRQQVAQTAHWQ